MAKVVKKKKKLGAGRFSGPPRGGGGGSETSNLRPKYVPKTPPCAHTCPSGTRIREVLTTIAQSEKYGRSPR